MRILQVDALVNMQADSHAARALTAITQGTSHRSEAIPCQDCAKVLLSADGTVFGAISDGVGSARLSHHGSALAVTAALEALAKMSSTDWDSVEHVALAGQCLLEHVQEKARKLAVELQCCDDDLHCTLLVFAWRPFGLATISVGDGFLVTRENHVAAYETLSSPDRDEFDNVTFSALHSNAVDHMRCSILHRHFPFLFASSDGLLDLVLEQQTWQPNERFFGFVEEKIRVAPHNAGWLQSFIESPNIAQRTADDLSAICVCAPEALAIERPPCESSFREADAGGPTHAGDITYET